MGYFYLLMFKKYQHLEKIGTSEVQGIEFGECYVFPKIDGTNGSVWIEKGILHAGSRRRELTIDDDNGGFFAHIIEQPEILKFLTKYPHLRLFGEFLIPHSLKTYRDTCWRKFYVFDVIDDTDDRHLHYTEYSELLNEFAINYIPPICIITNPSYEQFINQLKNNVYLIKDGEGSGEGIVIKNYSFINKYGRTTWGKIVTSEFKEKHAKEMGTHVLNGKKLIEEEIAKKYVTQALCEKEHAKIENESGWFSKSIPRLLNTVYYSVVKEDAWDFVKEHNNPNIDFGKLKHFVFTEVKEKMPQLF